MHSLVYVLVFFLPFLNISHLFFFLGLLESSRGLRPHTRLLVRAYSQPDIIPTLGRAAVLLKVM